MVKRYGKPSYGYGNFVERQLQHYKPYKKEKIYYEFEKGQQKTKVDYKKKLDAYDKALKDWHHKYEEEYEGHYNEIIAKYVILFLLLWVGIFLLLVIAESEVVTDPASS